MTYVISDIHGQYDKYSAMLERIALCEEDTLYILGDVIDRGPSGIRILQDMMGRTNLIPLLGNHEYMARIALPLLRERFTEATLGQLSAHDMYGCLVWLENGGDTTLEEFRKLTIGEQDEVLAYLSTFILFKELTIRGNHFVLVHAGMEPFYPGKALAEYQAHELIFTRTDYEQKYYDDRRVVSGHTPTLSIRGWNKPEVYEKNNHIVIDCGAGFGGKLACICLDTMQKYYC